MTTDILIAVYGSAGPRPGEPHYQLAHTLGQLLAQRGWVVMTGGYSGIMAAASQGAAEAGGRTLGITSSQIERWRAIQPNQWVQQQVRYDTFRDRLYHLVDHAHAAIAVTGGPGTLAEIALFWNMLVVQEMPPKPLILLGAEWRTTIETFYQQHEPYIAVEHRRLLHFADTPQQAVDFLNFST